MKNSTRILVSTNPSTEEGASGTTPAQRHESHEGVQRLGYEEVNSLKLDDVFSLEAVRSDIEGCQSWYTPRF